jgi:hypothetical protein
MSSIASKSLQLVNTMKLGTKLHTIPSTIFAAWPIELAWKPICAIFATSSAAVISTFLKSLKSRPFTGMAPSGTGSEGFNTASVAPEGAAPFSAILNCSECSCEMMVDVW